MAIRPKERHISCFLAIVQEGTIAAASKRLALTQPAISRTLADLEDILGARLMERTRAGITLTTAGETFLRYASASQSALDKGVTEIARSRRSSRLSVNVGVLATVAATPLPQAVRQFKAADPEVLVRIISGTNRELTQSLRQGELDFMVGRLASPEDMVGLDFEPLFQENLVGVVRKGHPLLSVADPLRLREAIDGFTILLPLAGTIIREDAEQLLISEGQGDATDMIETLSVEFGRAYVTSSDAVWLTPRGTVAEDISFGELNVLPLETGATRGTVGITCQKTARLSPHAGKLVKALRQVGKA